MMHKHLASVQVPLDNISMHYDRSTENDYMVVESDNSVRELFQSEKIGSDERADEIRDSVNTNAICDEEDREDMNSSDIQLHSNASDQYDNIDLKSPIAKDRFKAPSLNEKVEYSSSPIKKKSVAFSDELVTDLPSSPGQYGTPRKSILKASVEHQNSDHFFSGGFLSIRSPLASKESLGPHDPQFWIQGNIVQPPPGSPEITRLLQGCLIVLKNVKFQRRFEVYATLNYLYRSNSQETLFRVFSTTMERAKAEPKNRNDKIKGASNDTSNYISELSNLIRRDVTRIESSFLLDSDDKENIVSPSKNNPFSIRIISQALKFFNALILDNGLNNFLPLDNIQWVYDHSCQMLLKKSISKALISPYLLIIKEYRPVNKRRRNAIESTDIPEKMLNSILNMRFFSSGSIITEKFNALKNLVLNFPTMMSRNIKKWFPILIFDICTMSTQSYYKSINIGIHVLLEITKQYLNNKSVTSNIRYFLSQSISDNTLSTISEISVNFADTNLSQNDRNIDLIISYLSLLIRNGYYKLSMDIWVAITLLVGDIENGIENWPPLTKWLKVHKQCFNAQNEEAKISALLGWKAIIYSICCHDLSNIRKYVEPLGFNSSKEKQQSMHEILRPKVKLLLHLLLNITSIENERNIIDTMHHLFLSIIYHLFNPISFQQSSKYAYIYWDKIFQPVLVNFYFKKDVANDYMNQLGVEIMMRLLKNNTPVTEKNYSELRCLANDPVTLNEINSAPARWVLSKFDRFFRNMSLTFQLGTVSLEKKLSFFNTFFNKIKFILKKEIKTSNLTFDLIDNIPLVLENLLSLNKLSLENLRGILVNLHDALNPLDLINISGTGTNEIANNIYSLVLETSASSLEASEFKDILNLILSSLNDKKALLLSYNLVISKSPKLTSELKSIVSSNIERRKIVLNDFESEVYGNLMVREEVNKEVLIQKIKGSLINFEFEDYDKLFSNLRISEWSLSDFTYFLKSLSDTSDRKFEHHLCSFISQRFDNNEIFIDLLKICVDSDLRLALYSMRECIVSKSKDLVGFLQFDFRHTWRGFLIQESKSPKFDQLDQLLFLSYRDTEIDIKPCIKNQWDNLPMLRDEWLKNNDSLYIDQALIRFQEQEKEKLRKAEQELIDKSISASQNLVSKSVSKNYSLSNDSGSHGDESFKLEKGDQEADKDVLVYPETNASLAKERIACSPKKAKVNDSQSTPTKETATRKTKSRKSKGTKTPKRSKSAPTKPKGEKTVETPKESFDIHSFTALLTQKLSPSKESTKRKRSKGPRASRQDTASASGSFSSPFSSEGKELNAEPVLAKSDISNHGSKNDSFTDSKQESSPAGMSTRARRNKRRADLIEQTLSSSPTKKRRSRRIAEVEEHKHTENNASTSKEFLDSHFMKTNTGVGSESEQSDINSSPNGKFVEFSSPVKSRFDSKVIPDSNMRQHDSRSEMYDIPPNCVTLNFSNELETDVKDLEENRADYVVQMFQSTNGTDCDTETPNSDGQDLSLPIRNQIEHTDSQLIGPSESHNLETNNISRTDDNRLSNQEPDSDRVENIESSCDGNDFQDVDSTKDIAQHIEFSPQPKAELQTTQEESITTKISSLIENVSDAELENLNTADKHFLETSLMQFMLRMRNVNK